MPLEIKFWWLFLLKFANYLIKFNIATELKSYRFCGKKPFHDIKCRRASKISGNYPFFWNSMHYLLKMQTNKQVVIFPCTCHQRPLNVMCGFFSKETEPTFSVIVIKAQKQDTDFNCHVILHHMTITCDQPPMNQIFKLYILALLQWYLSWPRLLLSVSGPSAPQYHL